MLKLASLGLMSALSLLAQSRQLDMTTGDNYQNSDQGQGKRASLHGWFADLQYDLTERLAVTSTCKLVAVWSSSYWTESICRSRRQNITLLYNRVHRRIVKAKPIGVQSRDV
jgi:hypothetical protein